MQNANQLDAGRPFYIPEAAYRSHQSASLSGALSSANLEVCVRINDFSKLSILRQVCEGYPNNQGPQPSLQASTSPYVPLLLEIAECLKASQPGQIVRHPRAPVVGWYLAGPNGTDIGARCLDRDTGNDVGLEVPPDLLEPVANFLKSRF